MISKVNNSSGVGKIFGSCMSAHQKMTGLKKPLIGGSGDAFYLPTRVINTASLLAQLYSQHNILLEVAVPEIFDCLDWLDDSGNAAGLCTWCAAEAINGIGDWSSVGDFFWKNPQVDLVLRGQHTFVHPFKMKVLLEPSEQDHEVARAAFCDRVIPYMHSPIPS